MFADHDYPLPGDELIRDAMKQITRTIIIDATPETIWPLLLRMVCLDSNEGCAVIRCDTPRTLVLGGLYDSRERRYLPFDAARPAEYWHATWALVLTPIDAKRTQLDVRSRVTFAEDALRWSAVWTHPFHDFMERGATPLSSARSRGEALRRTPLVRPPPQRRPILPRAPDPNRITPPARLPRLRGNSIGSIPASLLNRPGWVVCAATEPGMPRRACHEVTASVASFWSRAVWHRAARMPLTRSAVRTPQWDTTTPVTRLPRGAPPRSASV